jgi:very-short-patch-repair endonuclease
MCLRDLPLRDALSVSVVARHRFGLLDARAENAFESSARAILLDADIAGFEPQVSISHRTGWIGRVDLADRARRIVIECEGFEFHSDRRAFTKDVRRFTLLVAAGWRPLRVTWPQVMYDPDWVLARVQDVLDLTDAAREESRRDPGSARLPAARGEPQKHSSQTGEEARDERGDEERDERPAHPLRQQQRHEREHDTTSASACCASNRANGVPERLSDGPRAQDSGGSAMVRTCRSRH